MKPTQDELDRIAAHAPHTSPDSGNCPLCKAFEGLERYGPGNPVQKRIEGMRGAKHGA